jgi:hypothetical protein
MQPPEAALFPESQSGKTRSWSMWQGHLESAEKASSTLPAMALV